MIATRATNKKIRMGILKTFQGLLGRCEMYCGIVVLLVILVYNTIDGPSIRPRFDRTDSFDTRD